MSREKWLRVLCQTALASCEGRSCIAVLAWLLEIERDRKLIPGADAGGCVFERAAQ